MSQRIGLTLLALFALALALPAAADGHEMTIADIVVSAANADQAEFSTLLAAVSAADQSILEALANPEAELTVFAPTDAAFAALADALGEEAFGEILSEDGTPRLNEILLYHVVAGTVASADVVAALEAAAPDDMGHASFPVVTLSGQALDLSGTHGEAGLDLDAGIQIDSANLLLEMVDIEASNGIIHVIDAVLMPELNTIADIVVAAASADEAQFTTLLAAAFKRLTRLCWNCWPIPLPTSPFSRQLTRRSRRSTGLDDIIADTALLTAVLQYHVTPGSVYSFQLGGLLDDMGTAMLPMANGGMAQLSVSDAGVTIDGANVLLGLVDIEASNGVIHVIDAVIAPDA